MCNPPFYSSALEIEELAKGKESLPSAVSRPQVSFLTINQLFFTKVCTGSEVEMIYPNGGEAGFVGRMVEESVTFQGRCR